MKSFINSPYRAIAPKIPCISQNCNCGNHYYKEKELLDISTPRPYLSRINWWNETPEGELPHLSKVKTPPRI